MLSKSNRAFSLIEVLIAVGILGVAITFLLRSFAAALASSRFSQNITTACLLAENNLWEIEQRHKDGFGLTLNGTEKSSSSEKEFRWRAEIVDTGIDRLDGLKYKVSWQESVREKPYEIEIDTSLEPK